MTELIGDAIAWVSVRIFAGACYAIGVILVVRLLGVHL